VDASSVAGAGGYWSYASIAGAFYLRVYRSATLTYAYYGARLAYI